MYREISHQVQVEVEPAYLQAESQPQASRFIFTYRIKITNLGDKPAQLVSRHWIITDGQGRVEEVRGPGVVGQQPMLEPGQSYEYSSYCPLTTPTGNMRGTFQMETPQGGDKFQVKIPLFFLRDLSNLH